MEITEPNIEMKPCLRCGGKGLIKYYSGNEYHHQSWIPFCICGLRGPVFYGSNCWYPQKHQDDTALNGAIKWWNFRL